MARGRGPPAILRLTGAEIWYCVYLSSLCLSTLNNVYLSCHLDNLNSTMQVLNNEL